MIRYTPGILKNVQFNIDKKKLHRKQKDRKNAYDKVTCYDIFTFDIEVTSAWLTDSGEVIGYKKHRKEDYWNSLQPLSLCYIWMFGINDKVYYSRELSEFYDLLSELPEMDIIIWVHNLAYEFHFLVNIMNFKSVFAKTPHKPMKCVPADFPYISFHCSYMLENLSLAKWGESIGCDKLVGDLDYLKIRTPLTKLTKKELGYCERDCIVLYKGILKECETYGNVFNIPLTSTGKIRRVIKDILYEIPGYDKYIKRLVPPIDIYKMLRDLFAGGYTHCNRYYVGRLIEGLIEHYDFTSSYPTVMCAYKFPCTPWIYRTDRYMPKDATFENYAFIFKVRFKNIYSTNINTYIQRSKCWELSGAIKDNGRIVSADSLAITINEYDWMIIKDHYKWDSIELIDSWYSKKDYLPKELIEYILQLFGDKTSLKDVEGQEEIYTKAKQFINALFGMAVTDIVQSDIKYDDAGNWIVEFLSSETVKRKLAALSNRYHTRDRRYFMSYSWGCWTTSMARYNLWKCMDMCTHNDIPAMDVLYTDTDSIFCKGHHDFTEYNDMIVSKLEKMCKHYNINPEKTRPKNPKGKICQLGIFDKEDNIKEFKCLHAKCYAYRLVKDDSLHITVAGVNKGAVDVLKNDIDNFEVGLKFDKDHPAVKKNMHTYVKDQPAVTWPDGYKSDVLSGINIRPTGYKIKNNDEFEKLLEFTQNAEYEDIDEMYINKLKGWFEYGE